MFLFDSVGFLALLGLFAQAAMTWLFVAVFAVLLRDSERPPYLRSWFWAFVALAIGLSLMFVRFFRAHDHQSDAAQLFWSEGALAPTAIYSAYLACKVAFAQLLVRGAADLAQRPLPASLQRTSWAVVGLYGALPWVVDNVTWLLAAQVPLMVGCCLVASARLQAERRPGFGGRRLVRAALLGTSGVWVVHGLAAVMSQLMPMRACEIWLALNSHVDAALELVLGTGLIVTLLQDAHERLREAQREQAKLREQADRDEKLRALGVLVSGVAHELNNPLTAILGFAHEVGDHGPAAYAGQVIREQAERCRAIVRSLSALAGECAHARERVDCRELAARVARGFQPQLLQAGVQLQLTSATNLPARPTIIADANAVEQVLANLVANAIFASPRGSTVSMQLAVLGDCVQFRVDDQGTGVPPELRSRLFEPFFTTKPPGQGTGLGLAVAFAIVRAHAGRIHVDDAPGGRGARFTVDLPLAADTTVAAPPAPAATPRVTQRRMLVIDDEPAICEVLRRRAEQLGWQVEITGSAEAAMQHLERADFDVVLCDVRMPGIGGRGFYEHVEQHRPDLAPRCIFFTGESASPEVAAFASTLREPLLTKPFDFHALFARAARLAMHAA